MKFGALVLVTLFSSCQALVLPPGSLKESTLAKSTQEDQANFDLPDIFGPDGAMDGADVGSSEENGTILPPEVPQIPSKNGAFPNVINNTADVLTNLATEGILQMLDDQLALPVNVTLDELGSLLFPDPDALGGLAKELGDNINLLQDMLVKDLRPSLDQVLQEARERHAQTFGNEAVPYTSEEYDRIREELEPIWHDIIVKDISVWKDTILKDWLQIAMKAWEGFEKELRRRIKQFKDYIESRFG
jgi:hypothetical protein